MTDSETIDASELVLKILSCIYRADEKYGSQLIAATLCGAKNKKIREFGLDKLSTYAIVTDYTISQVKATIKQLLRQGLIFQSTAYKSLKLTPKAISFIKEKPQLLLPKKLMELPVSPIFSTKILPTHMGTLSLWQQGKPVSDIAKIRSLQPSTIESHLADLIYHGKITNLSLLVTEEEEKLIRKVLKSSVGSRLRELKEKLPKTITYGQIKIVLAVLKRDRSIS